MARPTDRFEDVEAYGRIDGDRGEFWVKSPWRYPPDKNLSGYEPNQILWNSGDFRFETLTYISGAGSRGDGRAVLFADLDGDLAPDLIVRQSSLGPLRVFLNRFPPSNRLILELEGTKSNRLGIGTRIEAHAGGNVIVRELYPRNNVHGQQAARVNLGLGDAAVVERLVLHWPSGLRQEWKNVRANRFLRLRDGAPLAIERRRK